MQDVRKMPWAKNLEAAIKDAVERNAQKMAMVYICEDGDVGVAATYTSAEDMRIMTLAMIKAAAQEEKEAES